MKIDAWYRLRSERNALLVETDKTQLADFPLSTQDRSKYREYRQYLRDITKLFNEETIKTAKVKTFVEWIEYKKNGIY